MDYKQTLNLTLSDKDPRAMQQRANLPAREPQIQAYWDEIDLYGLSVQQGGETFVLHDGPPYSNGDIHLGHSLNKIAKDIIVKCKTMEGFRAPYVPGWDNHGMPIENEVSKEFRAKGERPDKVTMRRRCREYAATFVEKQKGQFKRLGVRGDWDNPYLTMSTDFEATIVRVFGQLAEKGYIYRGLKPVLWCPFCETALADAEVEYGDHTSNSIYVRFPVRRDPNMRFDRGDADPADSYVVIWTTTPWTIPANLAVAVHPNHYYVVVEVNGARYLLAEALVERVLSKAAPGLLGVPPLRTQEEALESTVLLSVGLGSNEASITAEHQHDRLFARPTLPYSVIWRGHGSELEGVVARHPLFDRDSPVVFAEYVTMEDGTGVVHTAPGHGKEDFETGQRYGIEALNPVDPSGRFTAQAGAQFEGARILGGEADARVTAALEEAGALLAKGAIEHSYPHCWRCHNPLIFRATVQWFMNIDHEGHRERALRAIRETKWYPSVSENRIGSMVAGRPDWCLSRQRAWGVGIPAFYCRSCGKEVITPESVGAVTALVEREGSDAWYALPVVEILPAGFACPHCSGSEFDKETDILDVWFDSGSSSFAVLENSAKWPLLKWPADVYLEGSDQHRGWFNSSLMVAVGLRNRAPYQAVITNGFTVDENQRKMSKSLGNVVDPLKVIETSGADILRLWVASVNYFEEVSCSEHILKQVAETYRRIRNTFRFLVNNLHDFDPAHDAVPFEEMHDLDRWAMAQLDRVVAACRAGYDTYEFHRVYHAVNSFCAVELSAFYLDVLKDRLYCDGKDSPSRRSAQTALHTLADTLARLLAPILSFTAEEVWGFLKSPGKALSPQLALLPEPHPARYADVLERWTPLMRLREEASLAVEAARQAGAISNPLEARIEIVLDAKSHAEVARFEPMLPAVLKASQVQLSAAGEGEGAAIAVAVFPANGAKCARCWLVKEDVGVDAEHADLCARCAEVVARIG